MMRAEDQSHLYTRTRDGGAEEYFHFANIQRLSPETLNAFHGTITPGRTSVTFRVCLPWNAKPYP
jgi:hypothetical protein